MATVRDIVKGSLRLLGAIATGETPSADEQADALSALNAMIDSWSIEGLNVYAKVREEFTVTPNASSSTYGVGGDFDSARPIRIEFAGVKPSGSNIEYPLQILSLDEWAATSQKSLTNSYPSKIYIQGTFPLETISYNPIPTTAATIVFYAWKPLSTFASANTDIELPQGYERAIRYNLAVELAPEYGKTVSAEIATVAQEAKDSIAIVNTRPSYLSSDVGILFRSGGSFDINKGE